MSAERTESWHGHDRDELRRRWGRDSVHLYATVPSTNDVARRLAEEEGAPEGSVVLAREQSEGRGREGRAWHSPPGGVYLSVLFRPDDLPNPDLLPLLAGLGVVRRLDEGFAGLGPALKWPNDVMVGDRKAGGVLCEAVWADEGPRYVVAGVGLNVRPLEDPPAGRGAEATWLDAELESETPLVDAATAVLEGLETWLPAVPRGLDGPTLELVDRYDWLKDRRVLMTLPEEEEPLPGACVGIAPDGKLLFRPDRGALRRLDRGSVEAEA